MPWRDHRCFLFLIVTTSSSRQKGTSSVGETILSYNYFFLNLLPVGVRLSLYHATEWSSTYSVYVWNGANSASLGPPHPYQVTTNSRPDFPLWVLTTLYWQRGKSTRAWLAYSSSHRLLYCRYRMNWAWMACIRWFCPTRYSNHTYPPQSHGPFARGLIPGISLLQESCLQDFHASTLLYAHCM
jgi:hypothetical protein